MGPMMHLTSDSQLWNARPVGVIRYVIVLCGSSAMTTSLGAARPEKDGWATRKEGSRTLPPDRPMTQTGAHRGTEPPPARVGRTPRRGRRAAGRRGLHPPPRRGVAGRPGRAGRRGVRRPGGAGRIETIPARPDSLGILHKFPRTRALVLRLSSASLAGSIRAGRGEAPAARRGGRARGREGGEDPAPWYAVPARRTGRDAAGRAPEFNRGGPRPADPCPIPSGALPGALCARGVSRR